GIHANLDVVNDAPEIRRHRLRGFRRRSGNVEGRTVQNVVDACRISVLLGKAIALSKGGELVRADAFHELVEVFAKPRLRPGAERRFEEYVERTVELGFRGFQVTELNFTLARFKVLG